MLARTSKGAIPESGDAEVSVPGVLLPIGVVGTPLDMNGVVAAATIVDQSFSGSWSDAAPVVGINVLRTVQTPRLGKGMWHLKGTALIQFAGTENTAITDSVALTFADGSTPQNTILVAARFAQAAVRYTYMLPFEYFLLLPDEGVRLQGRIGATVAGDTSFCSISLVANKLW